MAERPEMVTVVLRPEELFPVVSVETADPAAPPPAAESGPWGWRYVPPVQLPAHLLDRYRAAMAELLAARDALIGEWKASGGEGWDEMSSWEPYDELS